MCDQWLSLDGGPAYLLSYQQTVPHRLDNSTPGELSAQTASLSQWDMPAPEAQCVPEGTGHSVEQYQCLFSDATAN